MSNTTNTTLKSTIGAATTMMAIAKIVVPTDRMRALRPDVIDQLIESMRIQGQLQPIVARPQGPGGYWLVAGRHRLEAARKLKWEFIRATVITDMDAEQAELAEIDENLIRADLTPAECAMHNARRKEIYETKHPETKNGATGRGRGKVRQVGEANRFTKDTAAKTGQSERKVQRDITRANKVPVLPAIVGTSLDNGVEIDALAKLSEAEQHDLAERAKAGENVTAVTKGRKQPRKPRRTPEQRSADRISTAQYLIEATLDALTEDERAALAERDTKPAKHVCYMDDRETIAAPSSILPIPENPPTEPAIAPRFQFARLVGAWDKAEDEARSRFLAHIGATRPEADRDAAE